MGGKPKPAQREFWLARDPFPHPYSNADEVYIFSEEPTLQACWNQPRAKAWLTESDAHGPLPADAFGVDVPTDRPIKVRLHVEVVE